MTVTNPLCDGSGAHLPGPRRGPELAVGCPLPAGDRGRGLRDPDRHPQPRLRRRTALLVRPQTRSAGSTPRRVLRDEVVSGLGLRQPLPLPSRRRGVGRLLDGHRQRYQPRLKSHPSK